MKKTNEGIRKERQEEIKELMQKLNKLLGTNHNWSRLNKLDLGRLVDAIEKEEGFVKLNGSCSNTRLYISGFQKYRKQKDIPQFFTIKLDLDTIKPRERSKPRQ